MLAQKEWLAYFEVVVQIWETDRDDSVEDVEFLAQELGVRIE